VERVALFGAGGKMGLRIARKLRVAGYELDCVETAADGQSLLSQEGFTLAGESDAAGRADAAVLALPDRAIGSAVGSIVGNLRSGSLVICLDPAAPYAGHLPDRPDISYVVTHPCHPSVFKDEANPAARADRFGGVARQSIVCAVLQGSEADYERGEALCRHMFAPVERVHRISVEQMAILEPALSETVSITLLSAIKEAMDEAVRRGVPEAAARDFILGHIGVELAIIFGEIDAQLSDGAIMAARRAASKILTPDWKQVFEPQNIMAEIHEITGAIG